MLRNLISRVKKKLEKSNPDVDFTEVGFMSKGVRQKHDQILFRTDEGDHLDPDEVGRFITVNLDENV